MTINAPVGSPDNNEYPKFLNALYGDFEGDLPLILHNDTINTRDLGFLEKNTGALRARASNTEQVFFLIGVEDNSGREDWCNCRMAPSTVLWRDGTSIYVWALASPVSQDDPRLMALMDRFDMRPCDAVPMAGTDGWGCVLADPEIFYTLEELAKYYLEEIPEPVEEEFTGDTYNDARVVTPYNENDYKGRMITVSLGANQYSKNWKPQTLPLAGLIHQFTKHQIGPKDGLAVVFADMAPGQRTKKAIIACTSIGLDIDTGTPSAEVDKTLVKLGCLAIRTTTHSHGSRSSEVAKDQVLKLFPDADEVTTEMVQEYLRQKKHWEEYIVKTVNIVEQDHTANGIVFRISHIPMPKHRVIVPLLHPYVIADEGRTQLEAIAKWAKVPAALATMLKVPFDRSCTDPSRLFYTPRHAKDRPFEISLFGGPLFDLKDLKLEGEFDAVAAEFDQFAKGKSKSQTERGKKLGPWHKKYAHGCQIMDIIEDHAPDKKRSKASGGYNIECPNDASHSNAGDPSDQACFAVNAAEGGNEFCLVKCQHGGCKEYTTLDMIGLMLENEWFDEALLTDPNYNIAEIDEEEEHHTSETIDNRIRSLGKPEDLPAIAAVIELIAVQKSSSAVIDVWLKRIAKNTGIDKAALQRDLKEARTASGAKKKKSGASESQVPGAPKPLDEQSHKLKEVLTSEIGMAFALPTGGPYDKFYLGRDDDKWIWIYRDAESENGVGQAYFTPFLVAGDVTNIDHQTRSIRVLVRDRGENWTEVDIPVSALARSGGAEAIEILQNAGMMIRSKGKKFLLEYLSSVKKRQIRMASRAGWHSGAFILPTGGSVPPNAGIELAPKARIECEVRDGSFQAWQEEVNWLFTQPHARFQQFAILMGLGGPFADLMGLALLIYYLGGDSTAGKSFLLELAASQWGDGREGKNGLFFSARGTENAQEGVMAKCSGTFGGLDEVRHIRPPEVLEDILFMAHSRQGKRRAQISGDSRKARQFGGGFLALTDEKTLMQRLALYGIVPATGTSVRVASLMFLEKNRLSDADFSHVVRIRDNFGWGGPASVECLVKLGYHTDQSKLWSMLNEIIDHLLVNCVTDRSLKERAAKIPAMIGLTAKVLQEGGLIPKAFNADAFVKWLWNEQLKSDLAPRSAASTSLEILRAQLLSRKDVDVLDIVEGRKFVSRPAVAYYNAHVDNEPVIVIFSHKLEELAGGAVTKTALLNKLETDGHLVKTPEEKPQRTWSNFTSIGKGQFVVIKADFVGYPANPDFEDDLGGAANETRNRGKF